MPIKIIVKTGLQGASGSSGGAVLPFHWSSSDGPSKLIQHNLGTKNFLVQIFDIDNEEYLEVDTIIHRSVNAVELSATEVPEGSGWRVLIRA